MRNLHASTSRISLPPKPPRKPRRLLRKDPRARRPRLLLRRRDRLRLRQRPRLLLFQLRLLLLLRDRLQRLPPEPRLLRPLPFRASRVPASFRRRALLVLRQVRPQHLLRHGLALRQLLARDPVCRCVQLLPVLRQAQLLTELPDNPALLRRSVRQPRLHQRRPGLQLRARRALQARRQADRDFRHRAHRCNPAKAIRAKGPARRKACVQPQLRVAHLVPVVRHDRAVLRVPVAPQEGFRNVPAAQAAVPGKLRSEASVPAQPPEACPRLSQASRSTRASRPPRVVVRSSKSALPKVNAVSTLCAPAQARGQAAPWSSRSRPFSANRVR